MKINIIAWITLVANKLYRVFNITRIQEDMSDFLWALRSRVVDILLLLLFPSLYLTELQSVIELIKPII